jgi:hypothetical protein
MGGREHQLLRFSTHTRVWVSRRVGRDVAPPTDAKAKTTALTTNVTTAAECGAG